MALTLTPNAMQLIKFAVVGCVNVVVSFIVFYLCYRQWSLASQLLEFMGSKGEVIKHILVNVNIYPVDAAFANTIGYIAGMVNSFILNKHWTFEAKGNTTRQIHRFFILNIFGLILSTILIFVFVDVLDISYLVVWPLTIGLVMILNFAGNKYWTFSESSIIEEVTRG